MWLSAAVDDFKQQVTGTRTRLRHVEVWIGPEHCYDVCKVDHFVRDVCVEVEACGDGNVLSGEIAHAGEQFSLTVFEVFANHCAMQIQVDAVERHRFGDAIQDLGGNYLKRIPLDQVRWLGAGPEHRNKFRSVQHRVNKSTNGDVGSGEGPDERIRFCQSRPAVFPDEVRQGCRNWCEAVGFVLEPRNGYPRIRTGVGTSRSWGCRCLAHTGP